MTGQFKISYSYDDTYDEPYQARTIVGDDMIDAWCNSYFGAKAKLIKIIESIPDDEEINICGI